MGLLKAFAGANDRNTLNPPKQEIYHREGSAGQDGRFGDASLKAGLCVLIPSYGLWGLPV